MVFPAGLAPATSAFAERRAQLLHFGNTCESAVNPAGQMVRHAGSAPARSVWKTGMLLLHQWRAKRFRIQASVGRWA